MCNDVFARLAEKGHPGKVSDAIPEVRRVLPSCLKTIADLKKKYPLAENDNRPARLRVLIPELTTDI